MRMPLRSKTGRESRTNLSALVICLVAAGAVACGGGGGSVSTPVSPTPTTPPATSTTAPTTPAPATPAPATPASPLTFRVDGTAMAAGSAVGSFANGILSIAGTDTARSTTFGFAVTPTAAGVGTYTVGPISATNAQLSVGNPASGWQAAGASGSGTVTLTTLTSTSASGTFSFSLVAVPGTGATGSRSITEGVFNVTLTTTPPPAATPNGGNTFSTLIDGAPWTSSLSRRATLTGNFLLLTGSDTNLRVISLAVPLSAGLLIPPSGPATVSLAFSPNPAGSGVVTMVLGAQNWDNGHAGADGTLTITSLSATRITGTFTVTLVNNPNNAAPVPTARLTSGQFDMALERF